MPGPPPKDPSIRQRANKSATRSILTDDPTVKRRVPALHKRTDECGEVVVWHEMTRKWWRSVWRSPMAAEYLDADTQGLYRLAELVDSFWLKPGPVLAAEIRLQQQCFGLTPLDRRRLEWTVEQAESAKDKAKRRRDPEASSLSLQGKGDPRDLLRVVS